MEKIRIIVYDDLCELDETEMLADNRDQAKAVAFNMLRTTQDAKTVECWAKNKLIMKFNLTKKMKIIPSKTLHPGWGGRREGAGGPRKGKDALDRILRFRVDSETFEFLESLLNKKGDYIRKAIQEKRERDKQTAKGSQ